MSPLISILIAKKGRRDELARLLDGLRNLDSRESIGHEVIVAKNAADEPIANAVEELVKRHAESEPERWVHAREPIPGKSRALNRAMHLARGEILGFLDDDVEVTPSGLRAIDAFFRRYSFDVKIGRASCRERV